MNNLESVLQSAGVDYKAIGKNVGKDFINICCPFCGEERFHCGIHLEFKWFNCFICSRGGSWRSLQQVFKDNFSIDLGDVGEAFVGENTPIVSDKVKKVNSSFWMDISEVANRSQVEHFLFGVEGSGRFRGRHLLRERVYELGIKVGYGPMSGYVGFFDGVNLIGRRYIPVAAEQSVWYISVKGEGLFGESFFEDSSNLFVCEGVFDALRFASKSWLVSLGSIAKDIYRVIDFVMAKELLNVFLCFDRDVDSSVYNLARLEFAVLKSRGVSLFLPNWEGIPEQVGKDVDDVFRYGGDKAVNRLLGIKK